MAFLSGSSPKKPSGASAKSKELVIEIYDEASFTLARQDFKDGTLALCMSQHGAEVDRKDAATDATLKFLGGLVTNNEQNRAPYAQALQEAIPEGSVLKYLSPSMSENLSAWTVTDGDILHVCPAVWCVHMASHDPVNCLKTVRAFLNKAILNDGGWRPVTNTKVLQRLASPPGREPWTEYMRVALKPRGKITQACADELEKILREFPFLTHDGSLAYTPPSTFTSRSIIYKFATADEAIEALKKRDAKVWKATNLSLSTTMQEPPGIQEGMGSTKGNQAESTAIKQALHQQEMLQKEDTRESKAFEELFSAQAAAKLEEISEEYKKLQHDAYYGSSTNQDRVAYYGKLSQSKKEIQSFKRIMEKFSALLKEQGTFTEKLTLVLNSLAQVWTQSLTENERLNMTPLIQLSYNLAKESILEYPFKRAFSNVQMEHDEALIESFKQKTTAETNSQNNLMPDAFLNLVHPQWEKAKKKLQEKEVEFAEKEDYESAAAVATDLLNLETNTPENLCKMLQEQGDRDVILDVCDKLVANVVRVNPKETMDLERAYKRMRHN